MIVLDTNVLSEVLRPQPDGRVLAWLQTITGEVAITSITLAELLAGGRRLPDARRKTALGSQLEQALQPYGGTSAVLAFDDVAADHYAGVLAAREEAGLPITTADAQIAAICRAHAATCATRSTRDFELTGIQLVDPWVA
ncbi:plasmid stabilization protein [Serinicoccus sp. CNJ-927]|uniref:type II toxin-antitoxin system VapC family toxin n=1 Tax=Serinicoccus sp. CNJ-927 TaxID=1904970 RepID=UPI000965FB7C|nr:type II toxin-antitoxin system VapC family toxin [Serinicoccus sp. CNJ-927]OLT44659.1 plasmid stabilization protein [Serinicoccus sp. CNJ-927]